MMRLVAVVLIGTLAACSSSSAPLGSFTGTWVGSPNGQTIYTIHATQRDSVVSGSGTFVGPSESGSYTVSGVSKVPSLALTFTLTPAGGSFDYDGSFVTSDSVAGVFPGTVGGINVGEPNVPMSLKRQ